MQAWTRQRNRLGKLAIPRDTAIEDVGRQLFGHDGVRAIDVQEPFRNCWSYLLVFDDGRWTVECQIDSSGQERFIDDFCTSQRSR